MPPSGVVIDDDDDGVTISKMHKQFSYRNKLYPVHPRK